MRSFAAVLVPLLAGCDPSAAEVFTWPSGVDLAFVVQVREGAVVQVDGPFFSEGAVTIGLQADGEAFFLGWSEADLRGLDGQVELPRREAFQLRADQVPEPCAGDGVLADDRRSRRWPLPSSTQIFELAGGEPTNELPVAIEDWVLEVPVDVTACLGGPTATARPFRGDGTVVPSGVDVNRGFGSITSVDTNRVLAASGSALFLFDSAVDWTESPRALIRLHDFIDEAEREWLFLQDIVVRPAGPPGVWQVLVLIARRDIAPAGRMPALLQLELTAEGFGPAVVFERDVALSGLALDGTTLIAHTRTEVFTGTSATSLRQVAAQPSGDLHALLIRESEPRHIIVGDSGSFSYGNLLESPAQLGLSFVYDDPGLNARTDLLSATDLGERILVGTYAFGMFSTSDLENFEPAPARAPWAIESCIQVDECGRPHLNGRTEPRRSSEGLLVFSAACSVLAVGLDETCLTPVGLPEAFGSAENFSSIAATQSGWLVGGNGLLLEITQD